MSRRPLRRLLLVVSCSVLTGLTGCTGVDRPTRPATAAATPTSVAGSAVVSSPVAVSFPTVASGGIVLAVDRYQLDSAQTAYVLWSAEVATAQCVRGLGFDVPQPRMPTAAEIGTTHDRRYGVTSATAAAAYGYHLPNETTPPATDPYQAVDASALDGGTSVLNGHPVPAGGCRGQTTRTFRQDGHTGVTALAAGIDGDSYVRSLADPRLRPVFAQWSACMGEAGFAYATPDDAVDAADLTTATPSVVEIATATADVACKDGTGLVARWAAIESDLEAGPIAANLLALQQDETSATAVLTVGQRVTSVTPPA